MDRREFLRLAALASLSPLAACVTRESQRTSRPRRSPAQTPSPTATATVEEPASNIAWTPIDARGPGPRRDYTFTGDGDRSAFLFGGRAGGEPLQDMWRFADGAWSEIGAEGPSPRFGHNAAFVGERLLLFGGQGGQGVFFNDLWSFDPATDSWRQLAEGGPAPSTRYGAGGTAVGTTLAISHGFTDAGRFDDTWSFDRAWEDITPGGGPRPIERCLHRLTYVEGLDRLVLFGGQTNGVPFLGDTWIFEPGSRNWTEMKRKGPPPRNLYAAGATDDTLYVFGGHGADGELADLWSFDGARWSKVATEDPRPSARGGVDFAVLGGSMLLFGGSDESGEREDLWELAVQ
jgi:Galactose oxidase, central domain